MKTLLLATTAVAAVFAGPANAGDLPLKAVAPAAMPISNWSGPYIGAHVGAGRLNASAAHTGPFRSEGEPCMYNAGCVASATGVVGGVEAGYDWQDRYFV